MSPSTNQAGTSTDHHCEHCRLVDEKDERLLKALLRGMRTRDELKEWMHALNRQEMETELKEYAAEQGGQS